MLAGAGPRRSLDYYSFFFSLDMKNSLLLMIVLVIVVGAGSFYGGMRYEQSKTPSRGAGADAQMRGRFRGMGGLGFGMGGGRGGDGFAIGEILSKDDKSFTLKLRDGGSKIIFYTTSTQVRKTTDGNLDELTVGKQVTVNGAANSDGSVTAQMVQMRPPQSQAQP